MSILNNEISKIEMPEQPFYLVCLTLGESIFIEIAYFYVIFVNFKTLHFIQGDLKKCGRSISPLLIFHIIIWCIVALITLIHNTYVIAFWNTTKIVYDIPLFYITGVAYLVVIPAPAVSLFFSTAERCFLFIFHNTLTLEKIRRILTAINVITVMVFIVIILHAFFVSAPVPFNGITINLSPGSLSKDGFGGNTFNTSRIIISSINLFAAIILMIFIKKSNLQSETQKTIANLVKRVLLVQTFLDLGVHAIAFAASLMTKSSASTLLGPYARMFSAFSGLFCCICFARTIQKIKKDKNSITKMTLSSLPSQIKII